MYMDTKITIPLTILLPDYAHQSIIILPPSSLKAELRKSSEQMKKVEEAEQADESADVVPIILASPSRLSSTLRLNEKKIQN